MYIRQENDIIMKATRARRTSGPSGRNQRRKLGRPKSVTPSAPATWTAHDLRQVMLLFDSWRLRHMNSPHTSGDRYAIVLYNKDMDYKGTDHDPKSTALKRAKYKCSPAQTMYATTCSSSEVVEAREALEALLRRTSFPQDQTSGGSTRTPEEGTGNIKYGTNAARLLSFGATASRGSRAARADAGKFTRREQNLNNTNRHAPLYEATKRYLRLFDENLYGEWPRCRFDAFIIAKNSQCVWHHDYTNLGPAAITALGDYKDGGELLVETDDRYGPASSAT